jgi:hypothetical protein
VCYYLCFVVVVDEGFVVVECINAKCYGNVVSSDMNKTDTIVQKLAEPLLQKGYAICMDNVYESRLKVVTVLLQRIQVFCCTVLHHWVSGS